MAWSPKAGVTFGIFFMLFLFWGTEISRSLASQDELVKGRKKIQTIDKALTKEKRKLRAAKKKEKKILTELDRIEKQIAVKKQKLGKIQADLKEAEDKIKTFPSRIRSLQRLVGKQEKRLKERLVARYKMGAGGYLKLLLASQTRISFDSRIRFMNAILEHDTRLIRDYQNNLDLLNKSKEKLELIEEELIRGRKATQDQRKELARKEREKRQFLRSIKTKKVLYVKAIREYEEAAKELQKLLKKLGKRGSEPKRRKIIETRRTFEYWKGRLPVPLKGRISKRFGKKVHPLLHTYVFYKGIGIEAPIGSRVRSIFQGRVIFSGWVKGYGNILIINHGDNYYTLFAHLSKSLKGMGERVKRGEIIGMVGDSNSLEGAHLYFEIRQNGKPVNPLNWLALK
jgi:septal ring factor EnvC (AmiA/AmiB activator)